MNFLTIQDIAKMPIGSKFYRHTNDPYFGKKYTLEKTTSNGDLVQVSFKSNRASNSLTYRTWDFSDVERKALLTAFDPYVVLTVSVQHQTQNIPRPTPVPGPSRPYSQVPPPGYTGAPVKWQELFLYMELECSNVNAGPALFTVTEIHRRPHGRSSVVMEKTDIYGSVARIELIEQDYDRHQWRETHRSYSTKISQQIKQPTSQVAIAPNPCAEVALKGPIPKFESTYTASRKQPCTHSWFKDYVSMFDPSMDKYSCKLCGVKKEDVI